MAGQKLPGCVMIITTTTDANPNNDRLANQIVHNEHSFCAANNVVEPLFSFFNVSGNSIPSSGSSNYTWPTIAPSSIDYYDQIIYSRMDEFIAGYFAKTGHVQAQTKIRRVCSG